MEFRKYANLLVRSDGRIFITKDIEYPYFYRFKRNGETDGYPCVRINGGKCVTCHQVVARTWLPPPPNKRFKFVDHISRNRSDFRPVVNGISKVFLRFNNDDLHLPKNHGHHFHPGLQNGRASAVYGRAGDEFFFEGGSRRT